ncbi:unnamed protein product [Closterium sp. Naga37s-1]|nr:unnamed protein product [Closterium sp. Naga37s-1]
MAAVVAVAAACRTRSPRARLTPLTLLSRLSRVSRLTRITPFTRFNASRVVFCKNRPPRPLASPFRRACSLSSPPRRACALPPPPCMCSTPPPCACALSPSPSMRAAPLPEHARCGWSSRLQSHPLLISFLATCAAVIETPQKQTHSSSPPPPAPAHPTLSGGWSSRLLSRISFLATIFCAAIILVIASICFCLCCRQGAVPHALLFLVSPPAAASGNPVTCVTRMWFRVFNVAAAPPLTTLALPDASPCHGSWLLINRFSGLSHPHLLHLIGWSDQPLGQAGGGRRLRQVGESMRQWAQILWRKRGAQEQGGGGRSGCGVGGGSRQGEGEGSGRVADGGQAGMEGRGVGSVGGQEEGEEGEDRGKAGDQSVASSDCRVESLPSLPYGGPMCCSLHSLPLPSPPFTPDAQSLPSLPYGDAQSPQPLAFSQRLDIARAVAEALCHLHTSAQPATPRVPSPSNVLTSYIPHAQSPPPLAFSQRLDIATAVAEALCHLHTVAQPPLVHRRLCSSSIFLEVLPVARLANLGIIKGLPSSPCLIQQCHVAPSNRDPDWWERMRPTTRTDIYGLGIIMLELLSGCPATTTDQATASTVAFNVHQMLDSIATDDLATVLDPSIAAQSMPFRPIRSFARLAARCASPAARSRPDISTVVSELQGISRAMIRLSMARTTSHNSFVSRADSCLDSPDGSQGDSPEDSPGNSPKGSREELSEDSNAGSPELQTQEPVAPSWNGRGQFQRLR